MTDDEFSTYAEELKDRLFPNEHRDGPVGDVLVDAQFVRTLMAKLGGCRLWGKEYRKALAPFAHRYRELQHETAMANSVGHSYPMEDDDVAEVDVKYLRWAWELLDNER